MKENYKGHTIQIEQDEFLDSPRDWDNLGRMYCFQKEYDLGDKHQLEVSDFQDLNELMEQVKESESDVFLPLYIYDHSGIAISTSRNYPFDDPWDSGILGFIHVPASKIRAEYSVKRITAKVRELATSVLESEVDIYNQYLSGDVYWYRVEGPVCDDSCGGLYGEEYAIEEARSSIRYARKAEAKRLREFRQMEREAEHFVATQFAL